MDQLSSTPKHINVHELLGKIPTKDTVTPLNKLPISKLFETPNEPELEFEDDLKTRINFKIEDNISKKGQASKYQNTFSWAPETSPIVAKTPDSTAVSTVQGPTLVAPSTSCTTPSFGKRPREENTEFGENLMKEVEECIQRSDYQKVSIYIEKKLTLIIYTINCLFHSGQGEYGQSHG